METDHDEELPVLDQPPASGVFVDHDDEPLTDDDVELGNALGEAIDVDDDDDRDGGLL
ncbi:hypothetical protein [Blastococcus sp. CT_GayMR16]|uniref:hypothetical protein n=1 Tax=Blastococcus sp. CT_GayMR16 TaxID=2559607 RepID=UPI0014309F87|nr:hypothetical protein [Blastococcus sp. CT_GayMR16]